MEGVEELLAGYLDRVALALGRHILLKYTVFLRQIHKEIHCIFEKIHKEMHCIFEKNSQGNALFLLDMINDHKEMHCIF